MRLIDADYVTEKLNEINGTAELDKAFEVVENAPTVDVFEQVRQEIEAINTTMGIKDYPFIPKAKVLEVIDNYKGDNK